VLLGMWAGPEELPTQSAVDGPAPSAAEPRGLSALQQPEVQQPKCPSFPSE